jgi:Secretion system C-terminal sorting domain
MKKFLPLPLILVALSFNSPAQVCELHAALEIRTSIVKLDWNMVNNPGKTTYILLRSSDGRNWSQVVTDRISRKYSDEDIFDYEDKSFIRSKIFYRLKIIDAGYNAVAFSNIVTINTESEKGSWVIYPNPVKDILTLSFKGDGYIKGVINVQVQNVTGKTVIKFRAASINRNLQIPVSNLPAGFYVVQVTVMNEVMMNQKFIKE